MSSSANHFQNYEGKKIYLELLRILAILLVIFNHTDGSFLYYKSTDNAITFWYSLLLSILCNIDVPMFFMISGVLLLGRKEKIRDVFRKRVLRYFIILILFSFFMYIFQFLHGKRFVISVPDFFSSFLQGNIQESYWFLYSYLGFLILLPLLRAMAAQMKKEDYILLFILGAAAKCAVPAAVSQGMLPLSSAFSGSFSFITDAVFYSLIGYGLDQNAAGDEQRLIRCAWGGLLLGFAANILLVFTDHQKMGDYRSEMLLYFMPFTTVSVFCLVLCYSRCRGGYSEKFAEGAVQTGGLVFGIYLTEQYARTALLPLYLFLTKHSVGIIACSVYVVTSFLFALVMSLVLTRIPLIGRLLQPSAKR